MGTNMRVLHVQLFSVLSGVQKVSLDEFDYSTSQDNFLIVKNPGEFSERSAALGVKVYYINELRREIHLLFDLISFIKICRIIVRVQPNILHVHSAKTGFLGRFAGLLFRNVKVIYTVHGFPMNSSSGKLQRIFYAGLERIGRVCTDALVVLNSVDFDLALSLGYQREKISLISNGVSLEQQVDIRQEAKVLFLGRYDEQKNPLMLLRCWGKINYPLARLNFYGGGELKDRIQDYVQNNGLSNVIVHNWAQTPANIMKGHSIFVLPSLYEGQSLALLEAMSLGLLVLVKANEGNLSVVEHGFNGLVFNDDAELVYWLNWALNSDNDEEKDRIRRQARSYVEKYHSIKERINKIEKLYEKIIK